jgi:hypothetical protein
VKRFANLQQSNDGLMGKIGMHVCTVMPFYIALYDQHLELFYI